MCSAGIAVNTLNPLYNRLVSSSSRSIIFDVEQTHHLKWNNGLSFFISGQRTIAVIGDRLSNVNRFSQVFLIIIWSLSAHLFQLHIILCWPIDPKSHNKSIYRCKSIFGTTQNRSTKEKTACTTSRYSICINVYERNSSNFNVKREMRVTNVEWHDKRW